MSLETKIMQQLKIAMKEKNTIALESLRAVKSAILLEKTKQKDSVMTEDDEIRLLQRLVKQRKDSAEIYQSQNREDLAETELKQVEIIAQFLPKQMNKEEVETVVAEIIAQVGAESMKDMGKVMGIASKKMAGKAEGKLISTIVKEKLG